MGHFPFPLALAGCQAHSPAAFPTGPAQVQNGLPPKPEALRRLGRPALPAVCQGNRYRQRLFRGRHVREYHARVSSLGSAPETPLQWPGTGAASTSHACHSPPASASSSETPEIGPEIYHSPADQVINRPEFIRLAYCLDLRQPGA